MATCSSTTEDLVARAVYGAGGSHRWSSGGLLSQAIFSFMPFETGPHAVVWAVRVASLVDEPLAFEHCRCPLKTTQTSQVASWADMVLFQKIAARPASSRMVMMVFR